jgi:hypothetical protein
MNEKRRVFYRSVALEDSAVFVGQNDITGDDLAPVEPYRVDEELFPIRRDRNTEVIADPFIEPQTCHPS